MFFELGQDIGVNRVLTETRPSELGECIEKAWRAANVGPLGMARPSPIPEEGTLPWRRARWHHLVYAFMLENTRLLDIGRRVVLEWLTGERLPAPSPETQRWIHTTEQLFFGIGWPYSIRSTTSQLRPDPATVRRNAYFRLLGMDLNHGADDGQAFRFVKPEASNREFALMFEALLIEVWKAKVNVNNKGSENQADEAAIKEIVRRLREMLLVRRQGGLLAREELDAVVVLSWFHCLLADPDPANPGPNLVLFNLGIPAAGMSEKIMRLGALVGIAPHARSDAYVELAMPMSRVLLRIETDVNIDPKALYDGTFLDALGNLEGDMMHILTHWSVATGRNMKDPSLRLPIGTTLRHLGAGASPLDVGAIGGRLTAYTR